MESLTLKRRHNPPTAGDYIVSPHKPRVFLEKLFISEGL